MVKLVEPTKACTRCGEPKPWSSFHAAAKWEDGSMRRPQSRCKDCNRELVAEYQRRRRRESPEVVRAQDRARFARLKADPERMELWRARHRDYQAKRRRAEGKPERPLCSPYGRLRVARERVPALPLAMRLGEIMERDGTSGHETSARLGIADRMFRMIVNGEQTSVELNTVERVLIADATITLRELYPDLYAEAA